MARFIKNTADWVDQNAGFVLVLFSTVYLIVTCMLAASRLFWFDEFFTYYPARQQTFGQVLSFFTEGLDNHTPTLALLTHALIATLGDSHLTARLPSVLGGLLGSLSIYAFISFRCPRVYAVAAMLLPLVSGMWDYSFEARPYGVVMGLAAFSMLCWQRATSGASRPLWLTGLGFALVLAVSLHYFAVFLWVPLGAATLVRDVQRREIDKAVWATLILSLFPLLLFLPLMQQAREAFLPNFWSRPKLDKIQETYVTISTPALMPLVSTVLLWLLIPGVSRKPDPEIAAPFIPIGEWVLVAGTALAPVYTVAATYWLGLYVPRYVPYTVTGLALLLTLLACRRAGGKVALAVAAIGCLGFAFLSNSYRTMGIQMAQSGGLPLAEAHPLDAQPWMPIVERSDLPLVVSGSLAYLPVFHYSSPELQQRLFYPASLENAVQFIGVDTPERNLTLMNQRFPLHLASYEDFIRSHREFLLLIDLSSPDWLAPKLEEDGAELHLLMQSGFQFLYEVELPAIPTDASPRDPSPADASSTGSQ